MNLQYDDLTTLLYVMISCLNFRDSLPSETPSEFIVTGSVDDLVKVWQFRNDRLELEHRLEGHALGVVSVAISSDGHSKFYSFPSISFKKILPFTK